MQPTLNRHWIREVDRRAIENYGMLGLVLMENAARGAVDVLMRLGCRGPVAIVCGKGNNAGDGFAMARHLDLRGVRVRVLLAAEASGLRGDAAANFALLQKCQVPIALLAESPTTPHADLSARLDEELSGSEWIVDALLGTGASGAPQSPLDAIISQLNQHAARKFAVDIPSGLDCDTGEPAAPTFRADHTATFVAPKPGLLMEKAQPYVGELSVVDIGAPRSLVEEILRLAEEEPKSVEPEAGEPGD